MTRTPRLIDVLGPLCGLILLLAAASARAGEPLPPVSKNPTIAFACMAAGGNVEYDSAAFVTKNPGPVYADLEKHINAMDRAFEAYLKEKYGFNGYAQCGQYDTLDQAKNWLMGRKDYQVGRNYKLVQTGWTAGGDGSEASANAPDTVTPTPVAQSAAADTGSSTGYWACAAVVDGVQYESAVFEGSNDSMWQRRAFLGFNAHMAEEHVNVIGRGTCYWKPTRAAAEAWLSQYGATVGGVTRRVPTGWSVSNGARN